MRKAVLIFFAVICLLFASVKVNASELLNFDDGEVYLQLTPVYNGETVRVKDSSEFKKIEKENTVYGLTYKTQGNMTKALTVLSELKGEIIAINDNLDYTEIIAYSDKILDIGERVSKNIQIIIKNKEIILGIPAVLGCY